MPDISNHLYGHGHHRQDHNNHWKNLFNHEFLQTLLDEEKSESL